MIDLSQALLAHGRLVPVHPGTKTPWIRSVRTGGSNDPAKISQWETSKPNCSWALRIDSPELIVLDLEAPHKGAGLLTLETIEIDHGRRLPFGPVATTASGGEHRYYRLAEQYRSRMRNWTRALPGVDLRVRGGMICIPPSAGREWIESFDEIELPELPSWFCDLLLEGRGSSRSHVNPSSLSSAQQSLEPLQHIPHYPGAGVRKNEWFQLFHTKDFIEVWNRTKVMPRDNSQSAFEFDLAMRAFGMDWSREQVLTLLRSWWKAHKLAADEDRFIQRIAPDAARASIPFRTKREQQARSKAEERKAGKTRTKILDWLRANGPATPATVATSIGVSRDSAKMQMHRMAVSGILANEDHLYRMREKNTQLQEPVIYPHSVTTLPTNLMGLATTSTSPAVEPLNTPQQEAA